MRRLDEVAQITQKVLFAAPAWRHTSMGVGGDFACLAFPANEEELRRLVVFARGAGVRYWVVGNLTNVVVADAGVEGLVISLKEMRGIVQEAVADGSTMLHVGAGTPLRDIVSWCAAAGFTGMEFCTGIPGTLGGAIMMNAGAFGGEIKDVIAKVRLMNAAGVAVEVPREELSFSYRSFAAGDFSIVVGGWLRLQRGDKDAIACEIARIELSRQEKHPLEFRSAGSVFKNSHGVVVGKVVEELGLKGTSSGDAQISTKHGNFIVNRGHATAADVVALIAMVKDEARRRLGLELETEVKLLGF